ncbi:LysR family transcriptional regulator [Pseudopelagicola sp. nBUS_19]|uniref:LysR family transcriptional regulator n=1 Tax=Pseudopelagicola sp. nBUS_19 TaxID=3395316 RepID=UPI003EBD370F
MVALTGGFSISALRLDVSTSHVSRRVKSLQNRLGVKLLAEPRSHLRKQAPIRCQEL